MTITKEKVISGVVFVHDGDGKLDHLLVNYNESVIEDGALLTSFQTSEVLPLTTDISKLYDGIHTNLGLIKPEVIRAREKVAEAAAVQAQKDAQDAIV